MIWAITPPASYLGGLVEAAVTGASTVGSALECPVTVGIEPAVPAPATDGALSLEGPAAEPAAIPTSDGLGQVEGVVVSRTEEAPATVDAPEAMAEVAALSKVDVPTHFPDGSADEGRPLHPPTVVVAEAWLTFPTAEVAPTGTTKGDRMRSPRMNRGRTCPVTRRSGKPLLPEMQWSVGRYPSACPFSAGEEVSMERDISRWDKNPPLISYRIQAGRDDRSLRPSPKQASSPESPSMSYIRTPSSPIACQGTSPRLSPASSCWFSWGPRLPPPRLRLHPPLRLPEPSSLLPQPFPCTRCAPRTL